METFVRVVDAGSFSGAAKILGVAQPSVSRRVSALEAELGVSLLVRTTRTVSLTEAGARYLEAAREALGAIERARRAAAEVSDAVEGRLRISAPATLCTSWLAPRLPSFFEAHPKVDLQLHLAERFIDLVAEGMDLGIRVGGPDLAELKGRRLAHITRHLVASPAWVDAHGVPSGPEQLEPQRALVFTSHANWRGWELRLDGRDAWVRPRYVTSATNGEFLKKLVLAGQGVSVLPTWLVDDELASGALVALLPEAQIAGRDLWVVWPDHLYQRAAAKAFVQWLVAAWGGGGRDQNPARG